MDPAPRAALRARGEDFSPGAERRPGAESFLPRGGRDSAPRQESRNLAECRRVSQNPRNLANPPVCLFLLVCLSRVLKRNLKPLETNDMRWRHCPRQAALRAATHSLYVRKVRAKHCSATWSPEKQFGLGKSHLGSANPGFRVANSSQLFSQLHRESMLLHGKSMLFA